MGHKLNLVDCIIISIAVMIGNFENDSYRLGDNVYNINPTIPDGC